MRSWVLTTDRELEAPLPHPAPKAFGYSIMVIIDGVGQIVNLTNVQSVC